MARYGLCKSICYQIHMIHLYLNCYMVVIWTVMAVKIFLFQAYSNLIRHLQLESCKMGKLPVQGRERKIKQPQIALLLLH